VITTLCEIAKQITILLIKMSLPLPPTSCLLHALREALLKEIESKLTSGVDASNDMFILMAASVFYHEQNFDSALRCLNQSESLEG